VSLSPLRKETFADINEHVEAAGRIVLTRALRILCGKKKTTNKLEDQINIPHIRNTILIASKSTTTLKF